MVKKIHREYNFLIDFDVHYNANLVFLIGRIKHFFLIILNLFYLFAYQLKHQIKI